MRVGKKTKACRVTFVACCLWATSLQACESLYRVLFAVQALKARDELLANTFRQPRSTRARNTTAQKYCARPRKLDENIRRGFTKTSVAKR